MPQIRFEFPDLFGNEVRLAGDFNNWNPYDVELQQGEENWVIDLEVEKGTYEYKFVIDDKFWINDPQADYYVNGNNNSLNSIIAINNKKQINVKKNYGEITEISLATSFNKKVLKKEKKLTSNTKFNTTDKQIYIYNSIRNCLGEVEVSYVWCTPDLQIYDFNSILVQGYGREQRLYNYINLNPKKIKPGTWRVFILVNGNLFIEKKFMLQADLYYKKGNSVYIK